MGSTSCEVCGRVNSRLKCSRCKVSFYCSQKCQALGWRDHKLDCRLCTPSNRKTFESIIPVVVLKSPLSSEAFVRELLNFDRTQEQFRQEYPSGDVTPIARLEKTPSPNSMKALSRQQSRNGEDGLNKQKEEADPWQFRNWRDSGDWIFVGSLVSGETVSIPCINGKSTVLMVIPRIGRNIEKPYQHIRLIVGDEEVVASDLYRRNSLVQQECFHRPRPQTECTHHRRRHMLQ